MTIQNTAGRVAAVTGGSSGIGFAIAETLLKDGFSVAICGRSEDKGRSAVEKLGAGDRVAFFRCDVEQRAQVDGFIGGTLERFGSVDVLVNNAGGAFGQALVHEMSDESWSRTMALNVDSAFWAIRAAVPAMLDNRWGRIISISSILGLRASRSCVSHYITSKHALNGLTKAAARDYGTMGITANAVCVGPVETENSRTVHEEYSKVLGITYQEYEETRCNHTLTKQLNTVDQVAGVVGLLASDVGAGITGAMWSVDGGAVSA